MTIKICRKGVQLIINDIVCRGDTDKVGLLIIVKDSKLVYEYIKN